MLHVNVHLHVHVHVHVHVSTRRHGRCTHRRLHDEQELPVLLDDPLALQLLEGVEAARRLLREVVQRRLGVVGMHVTPRQLRAGESRVRREGTPMGVWPGCGEGAARVRRGPQTCCWCTSSRAVIGG